MTADRKDDIPAEVREAAAAMEEPASENGPDLDAMFAQLQGNLEQRSRLQRLADLPTPTRVAIVVTISLLVVLGTNHVDPSRATLGMLVSCVGYALAALTLMLATLRPVHRPALKPSTQWSVIGAAVVTVIGLAIAPSVGEAAAQSEATSPRTMGCLSYGTMLSLPVFLLLRWLDRGQGFGPWLAAVGAGVLGNLALQVHCNSQDAGHRLLGHAMVVVVVTALALLMRASRLMRGN